MMEVKISDRRERNCARLWTIDYDVRWGWKRCLAVDVVIAKSRAIHKRWTLMVVITVIWGLLTVRCRWLDVTLMVVTTVISGLLTVGRDSRVQMNCSWVISIDECSCNWFQDIEFCAITLDRGDFKCTNQLWRTMPFTVWLRSSFLTCLRNVHFFCWCIKKYCCASPYTPPIYISLFCLVTCYQLLSYEINLFNLYDFHWASHFCGDLTLILTEPLSYLTLQNIFQEIEMEFTLSSRKSRSIVCLFSWMFPNHHL